MDMSYGHKRSQSSMPLLPYADTSPTLATSKFRAYGRPSSLLSRRRGLFVCLAFTSVVSLALIASQVVSRGLGATRDVQETAFPSWVSDDSITTNWTLPVQHEDAHQVVEYPPWVKGAPTERFRDNLRSDTKYITSWISAGWTNDVMTYMNLIYLGIITDRVPIIAMFTPSHIGGDAPVITFGEVFDVPRFIKESGTPLLEWLDVKDPQSDAVETIGCWNIWESVQYYEHFPRNSFVPDWLNLDVSYTRSPDWVKMIPGYEHDKGSTFWALARLAYPEDRNKNLGNTLPSPHLGEVLEPDEHVVCYDYLYYACASLSSEYDYEYAPQWRYVGKYLHWAPEIESIATQYVNRALGLPESGPMPDYIVVHVRHGDFKNWCWEAEDVNDCFAPLSVIARRVREVQAELLQRKGINIPMTRVIMTSDETDETWWDEVTALGWVKMDHNEQRTAERYGRWHPVILDAAIQSLGQGFVGTDRSTFSVLSRRRVLDWQNGAARMVLWGRKGADDH
ncbi:hypothetical protein BDW22DRAFT_1349857 [Trametopsis cervina]|nr:hypothetical protein BDW22DRAFT_1349857 [Trametopsis cervina]